MSYPVKLSFKSEIVPLLLTVASFALGFYFYAHFPDRVITHWDFNGRPNGFSGKFAGAFLFPFILLGIYVLFLALPFVDPKADRYRDFAKVYHFFKTAIMLVMFAVFIVTGLSNLGYPVSINRWVPAIVGLLMIVMGNYMGKIKQNWLMGIRNPWTLSSENVWNKTHRLGGWMFIIFGLLIILSPFLPKTLGIAAFVLGTVLIIFGTTVYSYLLYRKEQNQKIIKSPF
jgi:uncharacterized membrane protein